MLLQDVKEAVTVSFTRFVKPITAKDLYEDLAQQFTHCNTHCVALENEEIRNQSASAGKTIVTELLG